MARARICPCRISFLPEQRLASQWLKSQAAAWKGGAARVVVMVEGSLAALGSDSEGGGGGRGRVEWNFLLPRKLSFL